MSLKISGHGKIIAKWVTIVLFCALFLVFLIRVAVWENQYYNEKEGSEREAAVENEVELVEEPPSDDEVKNYYVAPDRPRYLSIAKLGVKNARILPVSVNEDGELGTPNNIFDVGWYTSSGLPGKGKTMLIDGHNGGPHVHGVFKDLPILEKGDLIVVERGDGEIFKYSVVENVEVPLEEADAYMATAMRSPETGKESVTLISCTGEWSQNQGTYLSRQFTRAVLIDD